MIRDEDRRPAAVVLGIIDEPPHGVIFIERSEHLRAHAGQIGLPGGGSDPQDGGDLVRTALREMEEEVGVVPSPAERDRKVRIEGPVDTGASYLVVPKNVAAQLGVPALGTR